MNDWLVKFANQQTSDEDQLMDALGDLSIEELQEIASYDEPSAENLETFEEKVAQADRMGRELAHLHGDQFEKDAFLPLIGAALGAGARMLGGKLLSKGVQAVGGALADKATSALKPAAPAAPAMAGGFKYASQKEAGLMGSAMGMLKKPGVTNFLKEQGKELAINKGKQMLSGAGHAAAAPAAQAAPMAAAPAASGGFSYGTGKFASVRSLYIASLEKQAGWSDSLVKTVGSSTKGNGFLRGAAAKMMRDPAMATALAGAAIGVGKGLLSNPGVDPQTGMPRSRLGAALRGGVVGGGLGYAGGKFIPGAAEKVQGLGKDLSKSLRSSKNIEDMTAHAHQLPPPVPAAAGAAPAPAAAAAQAAPPAPANVPMKPVRDVSGLSTQDPFVQPTPANLPGQMLDQGVVNMPALRKQFAASGSMGKNAMRMMTPVERIKLAMLAKQSANSPMFSTRISPAAAGQAVRGGVSSGIGGAMQAASRAAKPAAPPPTPAARPNAGLAGVQNQLNSAQSIAGGGMPGMGRSTVNWNGF